MAEKMLSSVKLGTRPRIFLIFSNSSGSKPNSWACSTVVSSLLMASICTALVWPTKLHILPGAAECRYIPPNPVFLGKNTAVTFVLLLVYAAVFVWMILRFRFFKIQGIRRVYILLAFVLKLLAGAALSALYSGHYDDRTTGDTYRFFDDATVMYSSLFEEETPETYLRLLFGIDEKTDPLAKKYYYTMTHMERPFGVGFFNDNITIIKANAFLMLFSGGYYPTHVLFWCFMSLIGLTALMRLLVVYFPRKKWAMFFAVYLLPTTVFWTSGVLKDGLLILGFGLFLRGFFHFIYGDFERRHFPGLLIGLALLMFVKGYVLFCMAPPLIGLLLAKLTHGRRFWLVFSIPHALALLMVFFGGHLHPEFNVA